MQFVKNPQLHICRICFNAFLKSLNAFMNSVKMLDLTKAIVSVFLQP